MIRTRWFTQSPDGYLWTNVLAHQKVSGKSDGGDATLVQPSDWNAGHTFNAAGNNGDILQRDTSDGTFGAKWFPLLATANTWTATQTFNFGLKVLGDSGAGIGTIAYVGGYIVLQGGASGFLFRKNDASLNTMTLDNVGNLTAAASVSAAGFKLTGDPGAGIGTFRLASNQIIVQGGTGGFVFQKSDNSAATMTLSDAGLLNLPGAATLHGKVTFSVAPMVPSSAGTAVFGIDCTDTAVMSIVNNAVGNPTSNADVWGGMFLIQEITLNGQMALCFVTTGAVVIVAQSSNTFSTTAGTAGKMNLTAAGGVLAVENKLGSTAGIRVLAFRTATN